MPGPEPVAQVAHPTSLEWKTSRIAAETLLLASKKVPRDVRLLLTGGGYISLSYPKTTLPCSSIRKADFLTKLHDWTLTQLSEVVDVVNRAPDHDFVIGVDVSVNGRGCGQFALCVSRHTRTLVPKRFPVNDEAKHLAGVDAVQPFPYRHVVNTRLGPTLILVCHDAQAYNHRNRASVQRAKRLTSRGRAIRELDCDRATPGLRWALNLVHWIEGKPNTRTFRTSYSQLRTASKGHMNVAGAFGYDRDGVALVGDLLDCMVALPSGHLPLTKVVIWH